MPLTDFQQQHGGGGAFQFMDKSGFNAGGQAVSRYTAPTPAMPTTTQPLPSTPTTTVPTPAVNRYTAPSNKPTLQAVDENSIRETTRKNMQAQIDAINAQYTNLIAQEQVAGEDRSGQTRAMNARGGLAGSDFGTAQANKTQQFNQQQVKSLEDQKASAVNSVLMNIEDRATAEIQRRKQEALGQYERDFSEYQMEQEKARGDFASLAKSGVDLSTLAPEQKQALFQQAGYDEGMGELIYNAMKPKAAQIDYKFEKLADGKGLFYGVDPVTGELKTQNVSVSVPDGFSMTIAPDGTPLIFNKDTGEAQIADGFGQGQFSKGDDLMEVSAGASLFDPKTGGFVGTAPSKPTSGGSGGGGGGIQPRGGAGGLSSEASAVLNGTLSLEDLTPTVRGKIAGELEKAGYQRTANLSAGQREQIDKLDTLLREADNAKAILDKGLNTGPLASRVSGAKALLGGAKDFTEYRSVVNNMGSILLLARSGAAVTPEEFERIKGFIPLPNDDEKTAVVKIERFKDEMAKARDNYIKRSTQSSQQIKGGQAGNDYQSYLNAIQ